MENEAGDGPSANTPFAAIQKSGLTVEPSLSSTSEARSSKAIGYDKQQARLKALKALPKDHKSKRQVALDTFLNAPRDIQRKQVEDKWAEVCYSLVNKVAEYQKHITDKDFGKLTQLIISAATAKDKVFHREDSVQKQGNVVFNLFGNVGLDAIKRMLQPPAPTLIVKEIPHEESTIGNESDPVKCV